MSIIKELPGNRANFHINYESKENERYYCGNIKKAIMPTTPAIETKMPPT